jgi:hypothetical protein
MADTLLGTHRFSLNKKMGFDTRKCRQQSIKDCTVNETRTGQPIALLAVVTKLQTETSVFGASMRHDFMNRMVLTQVRYLLL